MSELYSQQDVHRWLNQGTVQRARVELSAAPRDRVDRAIAWLSGVLADEARAHLAANRIGAARDASRESAAHQSELYERFFRGEQVNVEYINAGDFQTLLDALTSGNESVVQRFAEVFPSEFAKESRSRPESVYIARPLKALVEARIEDARAFLTLPEPKPDPMSRGYTDCLRAIADKDARRQRACRGLWSHLGRQPSSGENGHRARNAACQALCASCMELDSRLWLNVSLATRLSVLWRMYLWS